VCPSDLSKSAQVQLPKNAEISGDYKFRTKTVKYRALDRLVALLDRISGKAAGDALRAPFVLGNRRALAAMFSGAGATSVDVTTRQGPARFPSTRELVEAELRGWLPVMGVVLPEPEIGLILAEAENVLAPYVARDGELAFNMPAHLVSARKA
jgi:hypothetical protein